MTALSKLALFSMLLSVPWASADLICHTPATVLSAIQGDGMNSPLLGQRVEVEAIVTSDTQDPANLSGFFLQEEQRDQDNNTLTSEGIFVFARSPDVRPGDQVRFSAKVEEFYGMTQLTNIRQFKRCARGLPLPETTLLQLPLNSEDVLESLEGMRIRIPGKATVTDVYNLARFGEFSISNGRRFIPTDQYRPGTRADAIANRNRLNHLVVDDGLSTQNPSGVRFPGNGLSAGNSLRVGDSVSNLEGILHYAFGAHKLIPTRDPTFIMDNPRSSHPRPKAKGDIRIASFNVHNYFNGDGSGNGFPTPRGANTIVEFHRQTEKLVAALSRIDADIIGLMELENDGFSASSSIATLVNALNEQLSEDQRYAFIGNHKLNLGKDAIAVGLIYRPASTQPVGLPSILNSLNSPADSSGKALFNDRLNRPSLLQQFRTQSGQTLYVSVNHFKSKDNRHCDQTDDCDRGQGAYNLSRANAATALAEWLTTQVGSKGDHAAILLGDFNAYRMEDPLQVFSQHGYTNLVNANDYSFVFHGESGSLDHALVSDPLTSKIRQFQIWHINADEPRALDYNVEFKSTQQISHFFAPDPYRASDHDPVIIDLDL